MVVAMTMVTIFNNRIRERVTLTRTPTIETRDLAAIGGHEKQKAVTKGFRIQDTTMMTIIGVVHEAKRWSRRHVVTTAVGSSRAKATHTTSTPTRTLS